MALAVLVGLGLSIRPWKVYAEQKEHTEQYRRQARDAEDKRIDLTKQRAQLEGPMGREEAARKAGFTKDGEKPLH